MSKPGNIAGVSDDAVRKATGRTWAAWLRVLDKAGAKKMTHKEIASHLHEQEDVPGWWSQMVTVGYEQARGMREKYQKADGYSASASRTFDVPVKQLYAAWADAKRRAGWLKDADFTVRKATKPRTLRITWVDGRSSVEAYFYPKGTERSYVSVQHNKLATAREVTRLKAYWGRQLDQLRKVLDS